MPLGVSCHSQLSTQTVANAEDRQALAAPTIMVSLTMDSGRTPLNELKEPVSRQHANHELWHTPLNELKAATAAELAKVLSKDERYEAAVAKAAATTAAATEQRQQRKKSKPLNAKKQKTAAMIQLMVLKQKATGKKTIASGERYVVVAFAWNLF
jgi:hypothetical protein